MGHWVKEQIGRGDCSSEMGTGRIILKLWGGAVRGGSSKKKIGRDGLLIREKMHYHLKVKEDPRGAPCLSGGVQNIAYDRPNKASLPKYPPTKHERIFEMSRRRFFGI